MQQNLSNIPLLSNAALTFLAIPSSSQVWTLPHEIVIRSAGGPLPYQPPRRRASSLFLLLGGDATAAATTVIVLYKVILESGEMMYVIRGRSCVRE